MRDDRQDRTDTDNDVYFTIGLDWTGLYSRLQ